MEKLKKTPSWLRNGTFSGIITAVLVFIAQAIFELKIQNTYQETLEPFLLAPIEVSITTNRFRIVVFVILVVLLIFSVAYISERFTKTTHERKLLIVTEAKFPSYQESVGLTSTDVITEIVRLRQRETTLDKVIPIILQAANTKVITAQAAAEALEEFHYTLITLSDGRFTAGKE